jgi:asparagine synthase (glutamine-hydrolysing)
MCGIFVVINKKEKALDLAACHNGLSKLSQRGPDYKVSRIWDDRVFIGQTVLSITGSVNPETQTITQSKSGRYFLTYNGEIYNYKELKARWLEKDGYPSSSLLTDTVVLADLHDEKRIQDIPTLLDGMYAYCVMDKQTNVISFARDLQGEKSAFIYEDDELVIISSEIQAIFGAVNVQSIDEQVLRDYFFTRHFMQGAKTVYKNIRQLQPGNLEQFDLNTMQWLPPTVQSMSNLINPALLEENTRKSLDELTDELDALLSHCVSEMIPDRPFAAVISGGVDSSLLGHYLVKQGSPQLLIAVDHIGKDLISCDLSGFEKKLGRPIDIIRINQDQYSSAIIGCQRICGSPLPSHSFVAQSLQSEYVHQKGCKVLFGGEGGDELFGGYEAYSRDYPFNSEFSPSPYMNVGQSEIQFGDDHSESFKKEISGVWRDALKAYEFISNKGDQQKLAMMYADTVYQMANVGLRSADLMSMMWSVETRTILIRKPLLSFALNLPIHAKIDSTAESRLRTKLLLKRLFLRHYPDNLLFEKQGFAGFPNESASKLGSIFEYEAAFSRLGIVKPDRTTSYSKATLWKLANVEYFLRNNR